VAPARAEVRRLRSVERDARVYVAGANIMIGAAIITALRRDGYDVLDGVGDVLLDQPDTVGRYFERHRPQYVFIAAGRAAGITGNQRHPSELIHDNLLVATQFCDDAWRSGNR